MTAKFTDPPTTTDDIPSPGDPHLRATAPLPGRPAPSDPTAECGTPGHRPCPRCDPQIPTHLDPYADQAAILLDKAKAIVTGARRQSYGSPEDNFKCIAALWNEYLAKVGIDFTDHDQCLGATDVAVMMLLMKIARLAETPNHEDSWVDIAGYAACGWRCASKTQDQPAVASDSRQSP